MCIIHILGCTLYKLVHIQRRTMELAGNGLIEPMTYFHIAGLCQKVDLSVVCGLSVVCLRQFSAM